jgi:AmmeMemoRadiSam system protein A
MEKLTNDQGSRLLKLARAAIDNKLGGDSHVPRIADPSLLTNRGTFVTLKLNSQLRGCIGNIEPVKSICGGVCDNAVNAAFYDHRFAPLSDEEFKKIDISISVLSKAKKLSYSDENDLIAKLRPYKDGVILRQGSAGATFLPQVWEQLPDVEQFLTHLCRKAGLSENCWRDGDVEILVYQVQSFIEDSK